MRSFHNICNNPILSRHVVLFVAMLNSIMACSEEDVGKSCLSDTEQEGTSSSKKLVRKLLNDS